MLLKIKKIWLRKTPASEENYLNKHFCRHCKFLNEGLFPGLRGHSLKLGRLSNFLPVKRRAHSKVVFIQAGALFSVITVSKHRAKKKDILVTLCCKKRRIPIYLTSTQKKVKYHIHYEECWLRWIVIEQINYK